MRSCFIFVVCDIYIQCQKPYTSATTPNVLMEAK